MEKIDVRIDLIKTMPNNRPITNATRTHLSSAAILENNSEILPLQFWSDWEMLQRMYE